MVDLWVMNLFSFGLSRQSSSMVFRHHVSLSSILYEIQSVKGIFLPLAQYVIVVLSNVDPPEDRPVPDISLCQRCRRPSDGNYTCTEGRGKWPVAGSINSNTFYIFVGVTTCFSCSTLT